MTTDCIIWTGAVSLGYPKFHTHLAHRLVYQAAHGPLPPWYVVHHDCRVKLCVNLDHLRAMSRREHMVLHARDPRERPNAAKTHCPAGHIYDGLNTYHYRGMRMCKACRKAAQQCHKSSLA